MWSEYAFAPPTRLLWRGIGEAPTRGPYLGRTVRITWIWGGITSNRSAQSSPMRTSE